jgi:hypothetical protein
MEGKTPEITKFATLAWDKNNPACVDLLTPVWNDPSAAPGGIADIGYNADGSTFSGTLAEALDYMHGNPILDNAHSMRVHSDAGLMIFTSVSWNTRSRTGKKTDTLPAPIALIRYLGSGKDSYAPLSGAMAFDIAEDCTNHGESCALNPKFIGLIGSNIQLPARPSSEIPGSPGGTMVTFDHLGLLVSSSLNESYTSGTQYTSGVPKNILVWHDAFCWSKGGKHYYAVSGSPDGMSTAMHAVIYPVLIFDVTNIRTSMPTRPKYTDHPDFLKTPVVVDGEWYAEAFYWHDLVVEGDYAYLNYEGVWGTKSSDAATDIYQDRVNKSGRIAIFNIAGYDADANDFPYVGMVHATRSWHEAQANGIHYSSQNSDAFYLHNINVVKVGAKSYLVQSEGYAGITVYDVSVRPEDPPMIAYFDTALFEDKGPAIGAPSDNNHLGGFFQWSATIVPGKRLVMAFGKDAHYAVRWIDPADPIATDALLRTHDATLPRIKSPSMLYGVSESDRSLHELEVHHIDRELDVAVLSFKDGFTVSKPMTLSSTMMSPTVTIAGYDGTHNDVVTVERAQMTKKSISEGLVHVHKIYQSSGDNPHYLTLLHDRAAASGGVGNVAGFNYIKRQILTGPGMEVKTTLKGGMSGAPVLNAGGEVLGMVHAQYGDSTGAAVQVIGAPVVQKALTGTRCPIFGVSGSPLTLSTAKVGGYVSKGMSPMNPEIPTASMSETMSMSDMAIAIGGLHGYFLTDVAADLPQTMRNSVLSKVDDVRVGENADETSLWSLVCGSSAGTNHTVTYLIKQQLFDFGTYAADSGENTWTITNEDAPAGGCLDMTVEFASGDWDSEISYTLTSGDNILEVAGGEASAGTTTFCLGATTTLVGVDSYGDGWNGATLRIYGAITFNPAREITATVTLKTRPVLNNRDYFYQGSMML